MRSTILLAILLVGLTGTGAEAGERRWQPGRAFSAVPVVPPAFGHHVPDRDFHRPRHPKFGHRPHAPIVRHDPWPRQFGVPFDHRHRGPKRLHTTPWHYHPHGRCVPPWCLPSYHRHRPPAFAHRPLPVAVVLKRLKLHDFDHFTRVFLDGLHYKIMARNRHGRPVRLIVHAATGQVRAVYLLSHR